MSKNFQKILKIDSRAVIPRLTRDPRNWIPAFAGTTRCVVFAFFVLVFSFAAFGIQDSDVAQYLASGKYIVEHHVIPATNIFAYPNINYGMVWDEWLFHLIVYGIYSLAGFAGLAIFQIAIVVSIFALLYVAGRRVARPAVLLPILLAVLLTAHERFMLRADLLSLLFVAAYIFILEKYESNTTAPWPLGKSAGQENTKLIYALPFLQLIWANFHGFWILGLIIVAIYIFSRMVTQIWQKTFSSNFNSKLLIIFIASIALCFVNPYGVSGFKVPFERLVELKTTHSILLDTNADFYSPFSATPEARHISVDAYKILILLSVSILFLQIKKISLRFVLLYLAFLLMSVNFIRNIPLFAVVVAFIFPKIMGDLVEQWKLRLSEKRKEIIHILIFIILGVSMIFLSYSLITNKFYLSEGRTRRFGLEMNTFVFPTKAVEWLKTNKLSGPMFNDYNIGAYLNWQLYPEQQAFIDGRNNSYDIKFLENYFKIMAGVTSYQNIVETQKINLFLLNHKSNDTKIIIQKLYRDPDWTLVYFDELSVIFVKNAEVNREIIKKYKIDFKTGKNAIVDISGIKNNDDLFVARNLRGEFFLNLELFNEARYEFMKSLEIRENNAVTYNNFGITLHRLGDIDSALLAFLKAITLQGDFAQAHFNLANIYSKKEQWPEASKEYERALRLNSNFPDAYLNLGVIYRYHLNDNLKAKYFWEKYLEIYPNSPQAAAVQEELSR